MAEVTDTAKDQERREDEASQRAKSIWKYVSEGRRRSELEWFINWTAFENNQFLYYNTVTRALQPVNTTNRRDKVTINRVRQQVRSVVSYINQRKPQISTLPGSEADDAYLRSRKTNHLCDYWYDALEMNKKNKIISQDGSIAGIGWAKILWNKDALAPTVPFTMKDTGEKRIYQYGEVMFERCDPFEVYPDPLATCKDDMRYIVHAIARTIGELKNNSNYKNTDKLVPDKKLAASMLRQTMLRQNIGSGFASAPFSVSDLETVIVLEVFWRQWDEQTKKWGIRVVTITEGGVLLRDEPWELDEFPFEPFVADITGNLLQSKGIVHNIREPNRAVNDLVSTVLENARIMGKLNWMVPRGSNVNVITDETGQFIEFDVNPGGRPEQSQPASIPAYVENLVTYLDSSIMDLGGAHDASVGKTVFKGASGDLVQALQAGDNNTMAMLRDNYDDFLVRCFKLMLKTAKKFGMSSRVVRSSKRDESGQYRWIEIKPEDISVEDDIQVRSGSNLPFSSDQRQQFFLDLWKEKLIQDPAAVLKLMDLPDVTDILGDDEQDIERELNNIKSVVDGKVKAIPDPVVSEGHETHLQTLDKFIRSEKFLELKPEQQQMLVDHRGKHMDIFMSIKKQVALNQYEPIKRTEDVTIRATKMADMTPQERSQLFGQFNMTSDAFDIQQRGGLVVQDPADAEAQAQAEDTQMMDGKPMQISLGDNHQVHIETHQQLMEDPRFAALPPNAQDAFKKHLAAHQQMQEELMPSPGLVPDSAIKLPMPAPQPNQPKPQK